MRTMMLQLSSPRHPVRRVKKLLRSAVLKAHRDRGDRARRVKAEGLHRADVKAHRDRVCAVTVRARQARAEEEPRAKAAGPLSRADRQPPAAGPARAEGLHPAEDPLREDAEVQRHRHSTLHRIKMQAAAAEMLLPAKTRKTEKTNM